MITKKTSFSRVLNNIYFLKNEPISLVHFITNRCNARCSFCFIDFDNPETFKGELSLEEIDTLTKNLGKSLMNVNFTGGEPFARKDIVDIAKLYIKILQSSQFILLQMQVYRIEFIIFRKRFLSMMILSNNHIKFRLMICLSDMIK